MKKAKRILTLLLAVVMVANVFAFTAFAADAGLTINFAAPETVEAGSTFTVVVNMKSSAEYPNWGPGAFAIAYDSSLVSTKVSDIAILDGWTNIADGAYTTLGNSDYDGAPTATEKANYGWDTYKVVGITSKTQGANADHTAGLDTVAITFTVAEGVADGTKIYVGMPSAAVEEVYEMSLLNATAGTEKYGNIDDEFMDYEYNYNIDGALVEVTVGAPAPAVTVESKGTMAHMNNWEDTAATTYTAGLLGQINGLKLTFDETTGECNEIKEIKVTIEGSDEEGYAYQVYKVDDTTYQFRAILLNAPKTGTTALNYTFHVKLADDTVVTCSDSTTAKEIFDAAYGRYQASKNA